MFGVSENLALLVPGAIPPPWEALLGAVRPPVSKQNCLSSKAEGFTAIFNIFLLSSSTSFHILFSLVRSFGRSTSTLVVVSIIITLIHFSFFISIMSTTGTTTSLQDPETVGKSPYINIDSQATSLRQSSPMPAPKRPGHPRHKSSIRVEDSFTQPRDIERHSKLPYFLRMHGSITPRMLVPLGFIGAWATLITCISHFVHPLVVSEILLTVLGFVVGLGISFRTSSAYERYVDGRKYWAQLSQASRDLARYIWIHVDERHEQDAALGKQDLLGKVTALNLLVAFSVALKHRLRFEPYAQYDDLEHLVSHLSTFAGEAFDPATSAPRPKTSWKRGGEYLGLTFAESNPRKMIKRSKKNLGNLPLEVLTYLSSYVKSVIKSGQFTNGTEQAMVLVSSRTFTLQFHQRVPWWETFKTPVETC